MSQLTEKMADMTLRFNELSSRERWLVLGVAWALIAWLGLLLYDATLGANLTALEQERVRLQSQISQQEQLSADISQGIATITSNDEARHIARLSKRLDRLNDNVDLSLKTLVEPEQMSALLLSMLQSSKGLTLRELSNQAPQQLNRSEEQSTAIYRHDLSLHLTGSYMDLLAYVEQLEALSGRIFWRGLEFELEEYPAASIRLDFFTLSQHKELLRG